MSAVDYQQAYVKRYVRHFDQRGGNPGTPSMVDELSRMVGTPPKHRWDFRLS